MTDAKQRRRPPRVVAIERRDDSYLPEYRDALLRAGWRLRPADDVQAWIATHPSSVALIRIGDTGGWARLDRLVETARVPVVALLTQPAPSFYRRAFLAGAAGAAGATDSPLHLARVLQAAVVGYAVVPVAALQEPRVAPRPLVSPADRALLEGLAQGLTTDELARRNGCSERTVYRRMRRLCGHLQVRSRDEAIVVAQRLGLLSAGTREPER